LARNPRVGKIARFGFAFAAIRPVIPNPRP
jgi:hypothetical protein